MDATVSGGLGEVRRFRAATDRGEVRAQPSSEDPSWSERPRQRPTSTERNEQKKGGRREEHEPATRHTLAKDAGRQGRWGEWGDWDRQRAGRHSTGKQQPARDIRPRGGGCRHRGLAGALGKIDRGRPNHAKRQSPGSPDETGSSPNRSFAAARRTTREQARGSAGPPRAKEHVLAALVRTRGQSARSLDPPTVMACECAG
jgi:hypothetical protein